MSNLCTLGINIAMPINQYFSSILVCKYTVYTFMYPIIIVIVQVIGEPRLVLHLAHTSLINAQ